MGSYVNGEVKVMHPILFHIGSFEVRVWGLMVALGIIFGTLLATKLGQKEGYSEDFIFDYARNQFYAS